MVSALFSALAMGPILRLNTATQYTICLLYTSVHVKIKEGNRERIQIFEGFVLKRQNGGIGETFTVRRIASGVGVEKTFPIHSPLVEKIEVVRKGDVRRARLHYMRARTGKSAKIKTKEDM